jgi:flagellar FliJ protein
MSLTQLLELKVKETQNAYQSLVNASAQYDASNLRFEQLSGYRLDYMQQMESLGQGGGTLGQLRNRIEFISNLDDAITHLNLQLAQLTKQRHYYELIYRKAKANEDAIKMLIERKQALEDSKVQRREQKDSDEYAQKQWYTKQSITKTKTSIE